jgi:glycosyltransferase involved in cell wall biosynthesis
VTNAAKLFERWRGVLESHQEPGQHVHLAKDRGALARILVLDHCTPTPDQDAGSITAFNIMRLLCALGYKVTFIPEDNFLYMERYTTDLQRIGIEVLYAPYVVSVADHLREHGGEYDAVLMFRIGVAARHLDLVRRHAPRAKIVFHTSDLHFLREQRRAALIGEARDADNAAFERLKQMELSAMRGADRVIVHSLVEKEILARDEHLEHVDVFSWAIDVPGSTVSFRERADLAFIGGYQHQPNVDAVLYFVNDILPLIQQRLPAVRFYAVGSLPPPELLALASPDVIVTGYVPDITTLLRKIRIAVVPLRYGAGIKGKIGTALSCGLPCVATTLSAEGMGLEDGVNVVIADGPQAFADAVVRLYQDEARWQSLAEQGLAFVNREYSLERGLDVLAQIFRGLGLPAASAQDAVKRLRHAVPSGGVRPATTIA